MPRVSSRRQYLGCLLQPIARLADAAVENQLLHADLPHGVGELLVGLRQRAGNFVSA